MRQKITGVAPIFLLMIFLTICGGCSRQSEIISAKSASTELSEDPKIASMLALIEKSPDMLLAYDQLAILYIQKARNTGDFAFNSKAETTVLRALAIAPDHTPSRKLRASLHLTFHRFADALELGKQLNVDSPDDAFVYGVLTDANTELGNYPKAVAAAQKMVDLKPNSNSYARVAHLRWLHGDHQGAVEAYKLAARTADPTDKEAQSWCLVQLGDEFLRNGKYEDAERTYDEALRNFPNFHFALAGKGRALAARGDLESAVKYLTDAENRVPNVETIILLADIYTKQGSTEKAAVQTALVQAVEQNLGLANDQKRLALFWADRDMNLKEALAIAEREYGARKDIFTADTYAWCLFKNGQFDDASAVVKQAMRLDTGDARMLYHAGMIENARGNRTEAKRLLDQALKTNPQFDLLQADYATKALEAIK